MNKLILITAFALSILSVTAAPSPAAVYDGFTNRALHYGAPFRAFQFPYPYPYYLNVQRYSPYVYDPEMSYPSFPSVIRKTQVTNDGVLSDAAALQQLFALKEQLDSEDANSYAVVPSIQVASDLSAVLLRTPVFLSLISSLSLPTVSVGVTSNSFGIPSLNIGFGNLG